jgi:hypothetical protein
MPLDQQLSISHGTLQWMIVVSTQVCQIGWIYFSVLSMNIYPQTTIKDNNTRPWIDKDVIHIFRQKNKLRRIAKESGQQKHLENYNSKRKEAKLILNNKYNDYLNDIILSFKDNPKKFWSFVKATTKSSSYPQFLQYGKDFSSYSVVKSNMFNNLFQSVFLQNNFDICNDSQNFSEDEFSLNEIVLTESKVRACLSALDPNKASGPDNIPARILKLTADQISPSICNLFNLSLKLGVMQTAWKEANVTPVFNDGNAACVENYRPISLLCILSKVLERCVHNHIYDFISSRINKLQHGFQRQKNCTTQLIPVYHNILEALDKRNEIDIIYLDFTKAFDKVSHPFLF